MINFSIAGISGSGLFDPAALGIEPQATCTACWRGYVAHYSILNGGLFLTSLDIGLPQDQAILARTGSGPKLFEVLPSLREDQLLGTHYEGFQQPIPFTGGLLLADGFIRDLYVHMGFHPAWKYTNVRELLFEEGRVTRDDDRSEEIAAQRDKFLAEQKNLGRGPAGRQGGNLHAWIAKCFSRDY